MSLFNYECDEVKRKIEEVSPNYPQLTTYEKEWLFFHKYHYIPGIPVELECQTVNVNPTGMVSNAIPYQYQSAILKGNTKYRDIDTGDILDTFDETKNLELVSVKMPVLTTTGKNLLNPTLVERTYPSVATGDNVPFNKIVSNTGAHTSINMFNCEYGKTYTVSVISGNANRRQVFELDENNNVLTRASGTSTYTVTNTNTRTLYWYLGQDSTNIIPLDGVQLEQGSQVSPFEPYKSNILTVNESVELRKINGVQDELDLLTGELTQRIGAVVLDGSDDESWVVSNNSNGNVFFNITIPSMQKAPTNNKSLIVCDKLKVTSVSNTWGGLVTNAIAQASNNNYLQVSLDTNVLPNQTITSFKTYLIQNPITVQYPLTSESIKTVDLTPLNKPYDDVNHYQLTSNIPCEAILEVPVVSTGEQTLEEINN